MGDSGASPGPTPLADLRVIDLATVFAGPGCARYLADFGADVVKVERPDGGDTSRNVGWRDPADGQTFFWKLVGRNKRPITLDLRTPEGHEAMLALCDSADVLIENMRPGKLEALGLDPQMLIGRNPKLVVTRVTGFGQTGPYRNRPGFATLAEAMSGFAAINGEPDGPPLLPPTALTDEITAVVAAFATMVAVHSGVGQVVDVSLLESMFQLMGPLASAYAALGYTQPRMGSSLPYTVPRGTYETSDGRWIAVSTSSDSVAARVMQLIGLGDDERLGTFDGRVANRRLIDVQLSAWIGARTADEVVAAFESAQAAAAPVMDMADIATDPHVAARGMIEELDGVMMQGLVARLSVTPGRLRWAGKPLGADTTEVLEELGASRDNPAERAE
ncbi:MAG: CoA transferase [Actinomycetota bacterium]|nr:CoA transferase [Actinomycetota bacterium]